MSVCECIHCTQIRINFKEGAAVSWYSAFPCQLTKWEGPESQIPFFLTLMGGLTLNLALAATLQD